MNLEPTKTTRAVLTFADNYGRKASFSIPRARVDTESHEANEAMQIMLDSNALELRSIDTPTWIKGAKIIHTVRTPIPFD